MLHVPSVMPKDVLSWEICGRSSRQPTKEPGGALLLQSSLMIATLVVGFYVCHLACAITREGVLMLVNRSTNSQQIKR